MKADRRRRRGGWNYDPPPTTRSSATVREGGEARRSTSARNFVGSVFFMLIAAALVAALLVFHVIRFKAFSIPAAIQIGRWSIPLRKPASSPVALPPSMTPLPPVHNSSDVQCGDHSRCSDAEFAGLVDSLRRQWALVPEEIRSKCAVNSTYPTLEHCVLSDSISWLAKNPTGEAPWINPKNFDTAIMALCQKDPKSLALCRKP
jgi:hypothetical protein